MFVASTLPSPTIHKKDKWEDCSPRVGIVLQTSGRVSRNRVETLLKNQFATYVVSSPRIHPTMKATTIAVWAATVAINPSSAFVPSSGARSVSTSLAVTSDRRDAIGNIAKFFGGAIVVASDPAFAASNPALATFKTGPKRGGDGTFKPGKGMREKQSFDELVSASNPALATFKTGPKRGGDGTFKPGKGMREKQSFDELVSASNPALATFKSGPKRGGDGTFKPGKGMRERLAFDELVSASNPALATFKSGPKRGGDGTFKPGKGMRERLSFDELVSASNPALATFKSGPKRGGDGTFKPGKGMRSRVSFNDLS
eukprot:CCRYP_015842-RA/>CCRYP_015842-RA protein AED:0.14 eAED:0.14 QI:36/0/0/1/0/0/2/0/314